MDLDKNQVVVVGIGIVLISMVLFGVYILFNAPDNVQESPIDVEDGSRVDSNYLGEAYVLTLAGDSDESFQYSLNENYKSSDYELEVFYTNNTGLHTEFRGLGGAGSSSVASASESFEGELSEGETKTQEITSSRYAVAIFHFESDGTLKEGKVRELSQWPFVGIIMIIFGGLLLLIYINKVRLQDFKSS